MAGWKHRRRVLGYEQLEDRRVLSVLASADPHDLLASEPIPTRAPTAPHAASEAAAFSHTASPFPAARDLGRLAPARQVVGRLDPAHRRDVYRFTLAASDTVTISLDQMVGDADLYLFDHAGRVVALSRRAGARGELVRRALGAGTYYALVTGYRGASTPYRLSLNAPHNRPRAIDRAGDSFSTARDIGRLDGERLFRDRVGGRDRADVYRFRVGGPTRIAIELAEQRQDLDLYLYDARGRALARSVASGRQPESIRGQVSAGDYFVAVVPYRGAVSGYRLTLDTLEPPHRDPVARPPAGPPTAPQTPGADPTRPVSPTTPPTTPAPTTPPGDPQPLPEVPYFGTSRDWNVNLVQAPEAWAQGITGQEVVVAVVDTGVDLNHPELVDHLWRNTDETPGDGIDNDGNGFVDDVFGWNFADRTNVPDDTNGHGTHVAGTIAAARDGVGATGVAYAAQIMPVRVLGDRGSGSTLDVAAGIRYAVDNGADIINLSLGGGFSSVIRRALQYALQQNVFVAIAAGNDGSASPSYPAADSRLLNNVISVGAYDRQGRRASFSNQVGSSQAVQVDAPGVGIYSTLPGGRYGSLSGTSMAAPHVAGVAALALSANPSLSAQRLREILIDSAADRASGSDAIGRVDASRAVALALAGSSTAAPASSASTATTPSNRSRQASLPPAATLPRAATLAFDPPAPGIALRPAAFADTDLARPAVRDARPATDVHVGPATVDPVAQLHGMPIATAPSGGHRLRPGAIRDGSSTSGIVSAAGLRSEWVDRVMTDLDAMRSAIA